MMEAGQSVTLRLLRDWQADLLPVSYWMGSGTGLRIKLSMQKVESQGPGIIDLSHRTDLQGNLPTSGHPSWEPLHPLCHWGWIANHLPRKESLLHLNLVPRGGCGKSKNPKMLTYLENSEDPSSPVLKLAVLATRLHNDESSCLQWHLRKQAMYPPRQY